MAKPGLGLFSASSVAAAYLIRAEVPSVFDGGVLFALSLGVASSGLVLNQVIELRTDALMDRTSRRPLPRGEIGVRSATLVGVALGVASLIGFLVVFGPVIAALSAAALVLYLAAYTPLKLRSAASVEVGALSGALPVLVGERVAASSFDAVGWLLLAMMFLWQIPHFSAIVWRHRQDYRKAGMRFQGLDDPNPGVLAKRALVSAAALIAVSAGLAIAAPNLLWESCAFAAVSGGYALACVRWCRSGDDAGARRVFGWSLITVLSGGLVVLLSLLVGLATRLSGGGSL